MHLCVWFTFSVSLEWRPTATGSMGANAWLRPLSYTAYYVEVNLMRALLPGIAVTGLLLFETPCSGQTSRPKTEAVNSQSVAMYAPSSGDSCVFRERDEVNTYPNCVLQDSHGKLYIAQDYVGNWNSILTAWRWCSMKITPGRGGCTSIEKGASS